MVKHFAAMPVIKLHESCRRHDGIRSLACLKSSYVCICLRDRQGERFECVVPQSHVENVLLQLRACAPIETGGEGHKLLGAFG